MIVAIYVVQDTWQCLLLFFTKGVSLIEVLKLSMNFSYFSEFIMYSMDIWIAVAYKYTLFLFEYHIYSKIKYWVVLTIH